MYVVDVLYGDRFLRQLVVPEGSRSESIEHGGSIPMQPANRVRIGACLQAEPKLPHDFDWLTKPPTHILWQHSDAPYRDSFRRAGLHTQGLPQ